jgi:hypothetical protein
LLSELEELELELELDDEDEDEDEEDEDELDCFPYIESNNALTFDPPLQSELELELLDDSSQLHPSSSELDELEELDVDPSVLAELLDCCDSFSLQLQPESEEAFDAVETTVDTTLLELLEELLDELLDELLEEPVDELLDELVDVPVDVLVCLASAEVVLGSVVVLVSALLSVLVSALLSVLVIANLLAFILFLSFFIALWIFFNCTADLDSTLLSVLRLLFFILLNFLSQNVCDNKPIRIRKNNPIDFFIFFINYICRSIN